MGRPQSRRQFACLDAAVSATQEGNKVVIHASSRLVDEDQNDPTQGPVYCQAEYIFSPDKIVLSLHCKSEITSYLNDIRIVVPVISTSQEKVQFRDDRNVLVYKNKACLHIHADQPLNRLRTTGDRLFNFVAGLEAVPFTINKPAGTIVLTVR